MKRTFLLMSGLAATAFGASSAQAVQTCLSDCIGPGENVLIEDTLPGNTVTAETNQTHAPVLFSSDTDQILGVAQGQARVVAEDGLLNQIKFELLDGWYFTAASWNFAPVGPHDPLAAPSVQLTYYDPIAHAFVTLDLDDNGQNFQSIYDGLFTGISFLFPTGTGVLDIRQLEIDGIQKLPPPAVPEPSTWAMMTAGLGLAGLSLRRRVSTKVSFA